MRAGTRAFLAGPILIRNTVQQQEMEPQGFEIVDRFRCAPLTFSSSTKRSSIWAPSPPDWCGLAEVIPGRLCRLKAGQWPVCDAITSSSGKGPPSFTRHGQQKDAHSFFARLAVSMCLVVPQAMNVSPPL